MTTVTDEEALEYLNKFAAELAGLAAECHRDKEPGMRNPWEEQHEAVQLVIRTIRCKTHWGEKQVLREEARAQYETDPEHIHRQWPSLEPEERTLYAEVAFDYSLELKGKIWNLEKQVASLTNKVVIPMTKHALKILKDRFDCVKRGPAYLAHPNSEVEDINSMSEEEFNLRQALDQDLLDY